MTLHARAAQLAMEKQELPADGPLGRSVAQLRELSQGALAEMRALIFELRPDALAEEGLVAAVTKHAAALSARTGLPIRVEAPPHRLELAPEVEEHLYRLVLEALNNTIKHAAAAEANVAISETDGHLTIEVADNGVGFDPAKARPGHMGMGTMRDRAVALGAALKVESGHELGTTITVILDRDR